MTVITRKKLIEVALPLEAINAASAREKSIRHGHPSTLHLWWARRPLAAARAVIFAQMVDDPSTYVATLHGDLSMKRAAERELKKRHATWLDRKALHKEARRASDPSAAEPGAEPTLVDVLADLERERLFAILRELVKWESTGNEAVVQAARDEIWQSWRRACADNAGHPRARELFDRNRLPAFHDPFAGGGALPLEAQRLGLESYASDLNPVAVLINKAMIEIPPRFADRPPVNPEAKLRIGHSGSWRGIQGLAEDVRYYGQWMRDQAVKRIGHLYPKVEVDAEMAMVRPDLQPYVGQKLTVVAWIWARTVKSPNPAFAEVDVPLASTFMLSTKAGKEVYVEPVIEGKSYSFIVKVGKPSDAESAKRGTKSGGSHSAFVCLMSGTPMTFEYLRTEASAGRLGTRLMGIVAEGNRGRVYITAQRAHEAVAQKAKPEWKPDVEISHWPGRTNVVEYGMTRFGDLFTDRQLVALTTYSDLVQGVVERVRRDALSAGFPNEGQPLREGGNGALAYGEAASVCLAFALDKVADRGSSLGRWDPTPTQSGIINTFSRQALPMTWDFAESNPLGDASGNYVGAVDLVAKALLAASLSGLPGHSTQEDAAVQSLSRDKVVSTDPPYYDNIGYADLSDFFYVWLRRSLKPVFPDLFATLAVPKAQELVATPYRHGGRASAESFFLDGMKLAMRRLTEQAHSAFPVTIYYAFKQAESDGADGTTNTGWDTFLAAVIEAGFAISGTWPMRTELSNRMIGSGANALASSIVLVCRPRAENLAVATRREFVTVLKAELPAALAHLQRGNIAPSGPRAGRHWPRHGGLYALCEGS